MSSGREVLLSDFVAVLARHKALVAACVFASLVIGLVYAILATPVYVATATVRIVTQNEGGGLTGLADRLGGAAALVGLDLTNGRSDRSEYVAILRSRELAEKFIVANHVMEQLFADAWDEQQKAWRPSNPGWLTMLRWGLSRSMASLSGDRGWRKPGGAPTVWQAYQRFEQIRVITELPQDGLVAVSFQYRDPTLAAEWATAYITMANDQIRQNAIEESSRALAYLNEEIDKTTVVDLRGTIYSLVKTQLEKIMLASARPEFAFKVIDKAVVPEERSRPRRALIVAFALLLGAVAGAFAALGLETVRGAVAPRAPR